MRIALQPTKDWSYAEFADLVTYRNCATKNKTKLHASFGLKERQLVPGLCVTSVCALSRMVPVFVSYQHSLRGGQQCQTYLYVLPFLILCHHFEC